MSSPTLSNPPLPSNLASQIERAKRNQLIFWLLAGLFGLTCFGAIFVFSRITQALDDRQKEGKVLLQLFKQQQGQLDLALRSAEEMKQTIQSLGAEQEARHGKLIGQLEVERATIESMGERLRATQATADSLQKEMERQIADSERQAKSNAELGRRLEGLERSANEVIGKVKANEAYMMGVADKVANLVAAGTSQATPAAAATPAADYDASAEMNQAVELFEQESYLESIARFQQIIARPDVRGSTRLQARLYTAQAHLLKEQYPQAEVVLGDAIGDEATFLQASDRVRNLTFRLSGMAKSMQEKNAAAAADFEKAIELNPGDDASEGMLAQTLHGLDRIPEAKQHADRALALSPVNSRLLRLRGHLNLEHLSQPAAAEQDYAAALKINEQDHDARVEWAICRFVTGDTKSAEPELARVASLEGVTRQLKETALAYLLAIDLQQKRLKQARERLQALAPLPAPENARFALAVAAVKLRNNEAEEARAFLNYWEAKSKEYYRKQFAARFPDDVKKLLVANGATLSGK